jgi:hypothetical protein
MRTSNRKNTPELADLEGASNPADIPGTMPPPGTPASVETKIRYDTNVNPNPAANRYSNDLRELAANEFDDDDDERPLPVPNDPLTDFCDHWREYVGYPLKVVRHPDPAVRRIPGQTYNRPCFEIESLGSTPFDPVNLVSTLQLVNGNSGGAFRLFLTDEYGSIVEGARLERIVIPDPPRNMPADFEERQERRYRRELRENPAPAPAAPALKVIPKFSLSKRNAIYL